MTAAPNNHLVMAILTTIFCCLPFGIVSIVKAAQVNNLWASGQYDAARKSADDAKKWWIVSACVSVGLLAVYFVMIAAVGFGSTTTY
ncbi:CD225/dispanin family protein [Actinospongicola halichondriae]|uniref:CD225/dispanin family protein n=1 Tax=Actinospongicola halichondriae TaxID=3236844 RepID=UPI003D577740